MGRTVVLSAARTPFGKLGGGLSSVDATSLCRLRKHDKALALASWRSPRSCSQPASDIPKLLALMNSKQA